MLSYRAYKLLQDFVHAGHVRQKRILLGELAAHEATMLPGAPSPAILELGCGGGNLAPIFSPAAYYGFDPSEDRIEAARRENPGYRFGAGSVGDPDFLELLPQFDFIFCHGVLHHLDDRQCQLVIGGIRDRARKPATFVVIEPILPPLWRNPPGWILAKMDDGEYVRTPANWRQILGNGLVRAEWLSFFPRWPVSEEVYVLKFRQ